MNYNWNGILQLLAIGKECLKCKLHVKCTKSLTRSFIFSVSYALSENVDISNDAEEHCFTSTLCLGEDHSTARCDNCDSLPKILKALKNMATKAHQSHGFSKTDLKEAIYDLETAEALCIRFLKIHFTFYSLKQYDFGFSPKCVWP